MAEKMKVCVIGASGVGKTSLVGRYVNSVFSEDYLKTIGVKIDSRRVSRGERVVDLILWDLSGEDEFQNLQPAYLRGAAGYLLVIDGTRPKTLDTAVALEARARETIGGAPFIVLLNKADLRESWKVGPAEEASLAAKGWTLIETSAKTGEGVEHAFDALLDAILARRESHGLGA
jgi:small GTP-binding protein